MIIGIIVGSLIVAIGLVSGLIVAADIIGAALDRLNGTLDALRRNGSLASE